MPDDEFSPLLMGQLFDCVPSDYTWLLRHMPSTGPELYFCHIHWADSMAIIGKGLVLTLGGMPVLSPGSDFILAPSFKATAVSPEEAFRQALRALKQGMV